MVYSIVNYLLNLGNIPPTNPGLVQDPPINKTQTSKNKNHRSILNKDLEVFENELFYLESSFTKITFLQDLIIQNNLLKVGKSLVLELMIKYMQSQQLLNLLLPSEVL